MQVLTALYINNNKFLFDSLFFANKVYIADACTLKQIIR